GSATTTTLTPGNPRRLRRWISPIRPKPRNATPMGDLMAIFASYTSDARNSKPDRCHGSRLTSRWGRTTIEDFQSRCEFPQRSFPDHVQLQLSSKMSRRRKMQTKRITSEATRADTTCLWVTPQPAQDCCHGLAIMK